MAGQLTWWSQTYGIDTFEQFQAIVDQYWGPSWLGYSPTNNQASELQAYQDPFGALGLYAQTIVSAYFISGGDVPKVHAAGDAGNKYIGAAGTATGQIQVGTVAGLVVPGCFQGVIHAQAGGQDVVNVVGLQNGGGTAAGAAAALQTAWKVTAGPLSQLSSLYQLVEFRAMDIGSTNGAIASISDTTLGSITTSNSLATAGACSLVKWNGGTRSASSRGRMYYGPIMEQNINPDGRTLASGSQTNHNTAFNNFRASLSASGYPLVVLSRKLSQAFPVTSSTVESQIATQRRRIRA